MDKNLPVCAGDVGSVPGLGRFHMTQSHKTRVPQLLSLFSRASKSPPLRPRAVTTETYAARACGLQQEKPLQ